MKTISVVAICFIILFSSNGYAKDQVIGKIIDNLDQKVKIMNGDRSVINLGKNNGLIKGDILSIYKTDDTRFTDVSGKCALTTVYDSTSICEIIKINNIEIDRDTVVIDKLSINDPNLYPAIFQLLTKVVEPYDSHKEIKVYVHNVFDEQNNITKFSESVQKEIKNVFLQKKRIKQPISIAPQPVFAYLPNEYAGSRQIIEDYLKKDNIDVLISGNYRIRGDKIELSLIKIDRNQEDLAVDTTLNAAAYAEMTSNVTAAYKPIKKEKTVVFDVLYKPVIYKANNRDERNNIIDRESKDNPFTEYNMKRIDFNIISPVDFRLIVDNIEVNFEKSDEYQLSMTTGKHEITGVFKKGFYFNDSLLLTSDREVKKDIVLLLDSPGDIKIEVSANPVPGRENIDFKIYKKTDMSRPEFKQVLMQRNNIKTVETFKD
jgi:hypothetical protein